MKFELRWKTKERKVTESVQTETWGGPTHETMKQYQALEYRAVMDENTATNWQEVPSVGLDSDPHD